MKTETPKARRKPRRPTRWQWGIDRDGRACIVLNNGTTREALAWDEGEGEWAGLGKNVRAHAVTGLWRPMHMMPIPFQDDAEINVP